MTNTATIRLSPDQLTRVAAESAAAAIEADRELRATLAAAAIRALHAQHHRVYGELVALAGRGLGDTTRCAQLRETLGSIEAELVDLTR